MSRGDENFFTPMTGNKKDMGQRLNIARKRLNLSQNAFGKMLGITKQTIINYEKGRITLPKTFILSLKELFSVNPNWLEKGEGEMFIQPDTIREKPAHYIASPTLKKIVIMLEGMTPDEQKEILKYLKERKLIKDLLKERAKKKDLQK